MVKVTDCGCCDCDDLQKKKEVEERALKSINTVYTTDARSYYPDGTGQVVLPLPTDEQIASLDGIDELKATVATNTKDIATNAEDIADAQTDIDGLKATVASNTKDIAINAENIAGEQTEINTLRDAMKTIDDNLDTANTKIAANTASIATHTGDITALKGRMTTAEAGIADANTKDTAQDQSISALQALTNNITSHLISSVTVRDGTQNGAIMVELTEESGVKITSPNYPWGQLNTFQLLQGSQAGYVRGKLILSDGTEIESNDFQILEVIESDVYVTSITLTPYPTTGKLGGTIGYSNGNTQTINAVDVPTAPGVTSNINSLLARMGAAESSITEISSDVVELDTRVTAVETKNTAQDNQIAALQSKDSTIDGQISSLDSRVTAIEETPGVGAFTDTSRGTILGSTADGRIHAESDGTGSVSGWSSKASVSAVNELATGVSNAISAAQTAQTTANGCYDDVSIADNVLTFSTANGETKDVTLPASAGDEWEELDLTNMPTDFVAGDLIRVECNVRLEVTASSWTSIPTSYKNIFGDERGAIIEFELRTSDSRFVNIINSGIDKNGDNTAFYLISLGSPYPLTLWNSKSYYFVLSYYIFNGGGLLKSYNHITPSNLNTYIKRMWRKKASS